jgi:predicted lipoprotein with Yx(FWY)xxD motif
MHTPQLMHGRGRRLLAAGALGAAAVLALAACSKSTTTGTGSGSSPSSSPSQAASPTANADAAITIATASIPGVGTVLVNGNGQTLYQLSSEQGGKLTCTDDNGCTKVWPDTELPSGKTAGIAGTGVQASLLGTVKSADGALYVTYNTFPLYTFTGDTKTGTAAGQGITSFGGTWSAITPAGVAATTGSAPVSPVATPSAKATVTPRATASSSGYGY